MTFLEYLRSMAIHHASELGEVDEVGELGELGKVDELGDLGELNVDVDTSTLASSSSMVFLAINWFLDLPLSMQCTQLESRPSKGRSKSYLDLTGSFQNSMTLSLLMLALIMGIFTCSKGGWVFIEPPFLFLRFKFSFACFIRFLILMARCFSSNRMPM